MFEIEMFQTNSQRPSKLALMAGSAVCAVLLMAAGDVSAAIIRLKPQASVGESVVVLGDVADVFDRDPQTVQALQGVILQPSPAAGSEAVIDFSTIRSRLQAKGFNLANLEFTGKSSVTVQAPPDRRTAPATAPSTARPAGPPAASWQVRRARELLSGAIASYLRTAELGDVNVEVRLDPAAAPLVVSGQASGYEVRGGKPPWDAWQTAAVRFIDRNERLQEVQAEFRVVVRPLVPTARRSLPRGHVIGREDVELKPSDARAESAPPIGEMIGRETTRPIRQGQAVGVDDVRAIPLVRRGDVVTAFAQVGGITVKRQLHAQGDGAMGERVMLSSLDRRDRIEATVVGYHEAAVLSTDSVLPTERDDQIQIRNANSARRSTD